MVVVCIVLVVHKDSILMKVVHEACLQVALGEALLTHQCTLLTTLVPLLLDMVVPQCETLNMKLLM